MWGKRYKTEQLGEETKKLVFYRKFAIILGTWMLTSFVLKVAAQTVNPTFVNLNGSADLITNNFFNHLFLPSPLGGSYEGGTDYGVVEKWGYSVSGLTPGVIYSFKLYYMVDLVQGLANTCRGANFSVTNGSNLSITSIPGICPANWRVWDFVLIDFTATSNTASINIEAAGGNDNSTWFLTDISINSCTVLCTSPLSLTCPIDTSIFAGTSISTNVSGGTGGTLTWAISPTLGVSSTAGLGNSTGPITFSNIGAYTVTFTSTNLSAQAACIPVPSTVCSRVVTVECSAGANIPEIHPN